MWPGLISVGFHLFLVLIVCISPLEFSFFLVPSLISFLSTQGVGEEKWLDVGWLQTHKPAIMALFINKPHLCPLGHHIILSINRRGGYCIPHAAESGKTWMWGHVCPTPKSKGCHQCCICQVKSGRWWPYSTVTSIAIYKETPEHFLSSHHLEWDSSSLELPCSCVILFLIEGPHCPECLGESDHCILRSQNSLPDPEEGQNHFPKPVSEGNGVLEGRGKQSSNFFP